MLGATVAANSLGLNLDLSIFLLHRLPNLFLTEASTSGGEEKATIAALVGVAGVIFLFREIVSQFLSLIKH